MRKSTTFGKLKIGAVFDTGIFPANGTTAMGSRRLVYRKTDDAHAMCERMEGSWVNDATGKQVEFSRWQEVFSEESEQPVTKRSRKKVPAS